MRKLIAAPKAEVDELIQKSRQVRKNSSHAGRRLSHKRETLVFVSPPVTCANSLNCRRVQHVSLKRDNNTLLTTNDLSSHSPYQC